MGYWKAARKVQGVRVPKNGMYFIALVIGGTPGVLEQHAATMARYGVLAVHRWPHAAVVSKPGLPPIKPPAEVDLAVVVPDPTLPHAGEAFERRVRESLPVVHAGTRDNLVAALWDHGFRGPRLDISESAPEPAVVPPEQPPDPVAALPEPPPPSEPVAAPAAPPSQATSATAPRATPHRRPPRTARAAHTHVALTGGSKMYPIDPELAEVGKSLVMRRQKLGLSQPEMALRVPCSRSQVGNVETGRARLSISSARAFEVAYGMKRGSIPAKAMRPGRPHGDPAQRELRRPPARVERPAPVSVAASATPERDLDMMRTLVALRGDLHRLKLQSVKISREEIIVEWEHGAR